MPAHVKKTVRFAEVDEYNYISRTPSPTFSDSTLSSASLMTPPQAIPQYLPFEHAMAKGAVIIHPVLGRSSVSPVSVDLASPSCFQPPLSPRVLAEPATYPPLPQLTVRCQYLPWGLIIFPASAKPDAFVTVADVLVQLYRLLRVPVKPQEYSNEPGDRQNAIARSFHERCAGQPREFEKGVRRIDFLAGKHRFLGLSQTEMPYEWRLNVGD